MPTALEPLRPTFAVLSLLCACGHASSSGAFAALDGGGSDAASIHDGRATDTAATGTDSSSGPPAEASTPPDAGQDPDDAGAVASLCVGLGGKCKDSTTCLCGVGSACTFDNVDCTAGLCAVSFPVPLDAGEECCAACQSTYDGCTSSSQECIAQWTSCNEGCAGECPVLCLAAQGMPGG